MKLPEAGEKAVDDIRYMRGGQLSPRDLAELCCRETARTIAQWVLDNKNGPIFREAAFTWIEERFGPFNQQRRKGVAERRGTGIDNGHRYRSGPVDRRKNNAGRSADKQQRFDAQKAHDYAERMGLPTDFPINAEQVPQYARPNQPPTSEAVGGPAPALPCPSINDVRLSAHHLYKLGQNSSADMLLALADQQRRLTESRNEWKDRAENAERELADARDLVLRMTVEEREQRRERDDSRAECERLRKDAEQSRSAIKNVRIVTWELDRGTLGVSFDYGDKLSAFIAPIPDRVRDLLLAAIAKEDAPAITVLAGDSDD